MSVTSSIVYHCYRTTSIAVIVDDALVQTESGRVEVDREEQICSLILHAFIEIDLAASQSLTARQEQRTRLLTELHEQMHASEARDLAPEKLENVYQRCPLIAQSYVHGDSFEASLVAIVVPDEEEVNAWARKNKVAARKFAELIANHARSSHLKTKR